MSSSGSARQAELTKRLSIAVPLFICPSRRSARPIPSVGAHVPINCPAPTGGYAKQDYAANGEDANVTTFSPGHGGPHTTTFPAAACDGSVRMVGYDIDADLWAKIRNRRDRAAVNWN